MLYIEHTKCTWIGILFLFREKYFIYICPLPLFDLTSSDRCSSGLDASIESGCWAGSAPERPRRLAAVLGGAPAKPGWGIIGIGGAAWAGSCWACICCSNLGRSGLCCWKEKK